jgi:hypothetical protein
MNNDPDLEVLRNAFKEGVLTLYIGAGISKDSGLPDWNTLVSTLYYSAVYSDWTSHWTPLPNYLYALSEWMLQRSNDPPEVVAGKIQSYIDSDPTAGQRSVFEYRLLQTLYAPWIGGGGFSPGAAQLRGGNPMLDAVAALCEASTSGKGLHAVVTTNYDCLLEKALGGSAVASDFPPIWHGKNAPVNQAGAKGIQRGIYHVHGYLPPPWETHGSTIDEIMLTEAHYHAAASDPYSWSNLFLISCLASTTGLISGMSLTDRNLRRLLNALKKTTLLKPVYIILKKPVVPELTDCDQTIIDERAKKYAKRFADGGLKPPGNLPGDLKAILKGLVGQEQDIITTMLSNLGVTVKWVDDYCEVPAFLKAISAAV